uniref:Uncharacterized protein n=1 Tax=Plectus sambesii TaxID=2011161 RepID=A0A914WWA6_9BILA
MKIFCTVLMLALFTLAITTDSLAQSSDTGAIGPMQADQCDTTTFVQCVTRLFKHLGEVPTDADELYYLVFENIRRNEIDGLKNICIWLEEFDECNSNNCWTSANFEAIGVNGTDSESFVSGFAAGYTFCKSDGIKPLLQNEAQCLLHTSDGGEQLLDCVSGLAIDNAIDILNVPCP